MGLMSPGMERLLDISEFQQVLFTIEPPGKPHQQLFLDQDVSSLESHSLYEAGTEFSSELSCKF